MSLNGLSNNWTEMIPGARYLADDDDYVRLKARDEHRDPSAEIIRHLAKRFPGLRITLVCQPKQIIISRNLPRQRRSAPDATDSGLNVIADGCGVRSVDFPTTPVATPALESILHNRGMAEFTSHTSRPFNQLVIKNQARPDPFRHGDSQQIAHSVRLASEPDLSKGTRIRSIFELHGHSCGLFQRRF